MKRKWIAVIAVLGSLMLLPSARPLHAQDSMGIAKATTLWVDESTGQVFIRPGRGRVPMTIGATQDQINQQIQEQTQDRVRAAVAESEAQERADNAAMQKQVAQMEPAWHNYIDNFQNKFRFGALAYLDYGYYSHTGFGPQWMENMNPPGVGNNGFNSFDINRGYLNNYFTPTDDMTFRFTPELYRANG